LKSEGQQVFPAGFSIAERPHIPKAMGSAPFDDEGVATRDRELIADGVLTGYILSSYSARKLGLQTTGNAGGSHNLLVAPTLAGGMPAMLARLGSGLLLTELMGQGVNTVTGDYSRGAAGFWWRMARFNIRWRKSPSPATYARCSPLSRPPAMMSMREAECASARSWFKK